jgi:hypothetical protein
MLSFSQFAILNNTVYYSTQVPAKHVISFKFYEQFFNNKNFDIWYTTTFGFREK